MPLSVPEQSVAGAWFKALPTTTILAAEVDRDARWVLEQLIALTIPEALTNEIVISATEGEIHVSGYETAKGCGPSNKSSWHRGWHR